MPYDLIRPSTILLEQKDESETVFDTRRREQIAQAARSPEVDLLAQVSWSKSQSVAYKFGGQGGQSTGVRGYLVFSTKQLAEKGIDLQKGDRVTEIAGVAVDCYLTEEFYAGHAAGSPRHRYWYFADKEPSKVADGS